MAEERFDMVLAKQRRRDTPTPTISTTEGVNEAKNGGVIAEKEKRTASTLALFKPSLVEEQTARRPDGEGGEDEVEDDLRKL
ncbi:hypothetical protein AC578_4106 [Pseudocercospora eumusae]|uniref:Uncharacterized protein n=1 Tax=Pseudocercospora eumusae TaxID=321146 RepID=A0A139HF57_9PEZI|nr:hypothetical protein AC578_4106 [Pseudocercospora eumusae]